MKKFALVVVFFLSATPAAWAINKCTSPDGKVSYQSTPCEASSSATTLNQKKQSAQEGAMTEER
ncbi:MAG: DUF4124 domain-containing protein, partial [Burkholderiales bacterium]|nr:DUF4124 domain-containing protein [Burkholderiales bacterium]